MRQSPEAIEYICHLMEGVEEIPTGDLKTGLGWNWEQFADYLNYIDTPHAIDFGANLPHSCLRGARPGVHGRRRDGAQRCAPSDNALRN